MRAYRTTNIGRGWGHETNTDKANLAATESEQKGKVLRKKKKGTKSLDARLQRVRESTPLAVVTRALD